MSDAQLGRCSRCGRERPLSEGASAASRSSDLCSNCLGFDHTARNTFGLLYPKVLAVEGGWREARILDGGFAGWLCRHVHATSQEAENCPEKDSVLAPRSPDDLDDHEWGNWGVR
jgi:hypothetical protein